MWRLTALLLAVASAAFAVPQGYNYLPPSPNNPATCAIRPVTSYSTVVDYRTQVQVQTINQVDTQYRTTTLLQQQVVPTTLFRTQVQTRVQVQTSVVQSVSQRVEDRFVTNTIPGRDVVRTNYATSTRVVPSVAYVTSQVVRTQVVPVEVTRTQVTTIYQPNTRFQTQNVQQTRVQTIPGRDVVRTVVNTVRQTSVIRQQLPGNTRFVTSTRVQNVVRTQTIPGRDVVSTRVVQSERVVPTVVVNTDFQQRFDTQVRYVTRTNVQYQTQIQTQVVPQEVVRTQVVPVERYTTLVQTQVRTNTQVQTVVSTQYRRGQDVVQTRYDTQQSVVQVPGRDQVVTRNQVVTQTRNEVTYRTVNVPREVVVTQTVTQSCSKSGYNYNAPAVPFNF